MTYWQLHKIAEAMAHDIVARRRRKWLRISAFVAVSYLLVATGSDVVLLPDLILDTLMEIV